MNKKCISYSNQKNGVGKYIGKTFHFFFITAFTLPSRWFRVSQSTWYTPFYYYGMTALMSDISHWNKCMLLANMLSLEYIFIRTLLTGHTNPYTLYFFHFFIWFFFQTDFCWSFQAYGVMTSFANYRLLAEISTPFVNNRYICIFYHILYIKMD